MTEMVERVAKAMEARFKASVAKHAGMSFEASGVHAPSMDIWREYAAAAIVAMRDPTPEMAGVSWSYDVFHVWREMIDAVSPVATEEVAA